MFLIKTCNINRFITYTKIQTIIIKTMNNNLMPSSHARCKCGRYATIGEWKAGIGLFGSYTCPDCLHYELHKRYIERFNK